MKLNGKYLIGDPVLLERYTTDWLTVKLHPTTYYRRFHEFQEGFKNVKGIYTDIDCGEFVLVRFTEKDDLTDFYRQHHEYL